MGQQNEQSAHTQIGLEAIGNLVRTNLQHGGFLVAEFRGSDGHPHSEEAKANAALFAAARDLLAVLIVAREFISIDRQALADCSTGPDNAIEPDDAAALAEYDEALRQIDAAIAKAKGSN